MENLTRDTAKSYLWNQVAVTFDGLTVTLASVAVGRFFGAEALGLFGWVISAVGLMTLVAGLGFKEGITVLVQRLHEAREERRGLFKKSLAIRTAAAVICAVTIAAVLAYSRGTGAMTTAAVAAYTAFVMLSALLAVMNIALFRTRVVAAGKLASSVVTLALVVAGGMLGSMAVVFGGFALGAALAAVIFLSTLGREITGPSRRYPLGNLLEISLSVWLASIFTYLIGVQSAPMVLKAVRLPEARIGLFTAALMMAVAANKAFMGGFANVSLAALSKAYAQGKSEELARMHSLYVRVTAMLSVPVLMGAIVFAPLVIRLPLSGQNPAAEGVLVVLAWAFLAGRIYGGGAHSAALYASGLHRAAVAIRGTFAGLSVAATAGGALWFGIRGAAAGAGAAGVLVILAEYAFLSARRGIKMPWQSLIRLLAACGAMALAAEIILMQGGAFAAGFAVLVFVVGSMCAVIVARPLKKGEVALIGISGLPARLLVRCEEKHHDA